MPKFRVLQGVHYHSQWVDVPEDKLHLAKNPVQDRFSKQWKDLVTVQYGPGSIVESDDDLTVNPDYSPKKMKKEGTIA